MKKRYYAATALICILMLLAFALASGYFTRTSPDNSMAVGLNYYLREYAHTHVSWHAGEPVELPEFLPKVPEPVTQLTRMPVRFFLNYCTFGYTMPWWKWQQWERCRETDVYGVVR